MTDFKDSFKQMIHEMDRLVTLTNKRSVLILLQHTHTEDTTPRVPSVRESITNIIGFVAFGATPASYALKPNSWPRARE